MPSTAPFVMSSLCDELVDDDVERGRRRPLRRGRPHGVPRQHERAAAPRLAGRRLAPRVDDAVLVDDLAVDHEVARMHDDLVERRIGVEAELEDRQAGLDRDAGDDRLVGDEALHAGDRLAADERAAEAAQPRTPVVIEPREERMRVEHRVPAGLVDPVRTVDRRRSRAPERPAHAGQLASSIQAAWIASRIFSFDRARVVVEVLELDDPAMQVGEAHRAADRRRRAPRAARSRCRRCRSTS